MKCGLLAVTVTSLRTFSSPTRMSSSWDSTLVKVKLDLLTTLIMDENGTRIFSFEQDSKPGLKKIINFINKQVFSQSSYYFLKDYIKY